MNSNSKNKSIGTSKSVEEAKVLINTIRKELDNFNCSPPSTKTVIDWGAKARGQGKRCGHMVMGSMSDAPSGKKVYCGIDISKYKNDWDGIQNCRFDGHQSCRYYKAREYGCNQIEARYYALK